MWEEDMSIVSEAAFGLFTACPHCLIFTFVNNIGFCDSHFKVSPTCDQSSKVS